ncbi:hypothetical protein RYX36_012282, partial [Vicia faba]
MLHVAPVNMKNLMIKFLFEYFLFSFSDPRTRFAILDTTGIYPWLFIDIAIYVASLDNTDELKQRRDEIMLLRFVRIVKADGNRIRKQSNPSLSPKQNLHRGSGSSPSTLQ